MKKILSFMLMVLILGLAGVAQAVEYPAKLKVYTYDEAVIEAKAKNKKIMLFFWADWCKYCDMFRNEVLPDPRIIEVLNKSFTFVSIDSERQHKELVRKFKVRSMPTSIFLTENGEPLTMLPGFIEVDVILPILEYLGSNAYEKMEYDKYLEQRLKEGEKKDAPAAETKKDDRTDSIAEGGAKGQPEAQDNKK